MVFTKNPAKLESRAQGYEMRGKQAKALKCRQKLTRLTGMSTLSGPGYGQPQTFTAGGPMLNAPIPWNTTNTPARYETNALKWEQRGNYGKANKNRGKVWRLQNPQYAALPTTPAFYQGNQFLGYNVPVQQQGFQQQQFQQQPFLQQGFQQQGFQQQQVETITRPTIVQETMRPERIVEVQPIVHREIDAPQVHLVERHTYENVQSRGPSTITNAPIIQETVKPHIIEEVQPVVHRNVPAPFVERVEQHVTEHIVKPTVTTKEVINGGQQPFMAAGGPLQQQQGFQQTGLNNTGFNNTGFNNTGLNNTGLNNTGTTTTQSGGIMGQVQNALHRGNNV